MHGDIQSRKVQVNGINMHILECGEGPLVICCHGWPELSYSWRHQIPVIKAAGYRVVAPDMRGFGKTDAPKEISQYSLLHLVGDIVALVRELGEQQAIIIGHDWGAPVAWHCAMLRPDIFPKIVAMSIPYQGRTRDRPLTLLREQGLGNFYWCYFQQPGIAEKELERDVSESLRKILYGFAADDTTRANPLVVPEQGGFLDNIKIPETVPQWVTEKDLEVFVSEYKRTGFRGGLNWYRNIDRNWELTAPWQANKITQPALFIGGTRDPIISGTRGENAIKTMQKNVPNLKVVMFEKTGHWVQQEQPTKVNETLLDFLRV